MNTETLSGTSAIHKKIKNQLIIVRRWNEMLHKRISLFNHKIIMNELITETEKERLIESILCRCKYQNNKIIYWREKDKYLYPHFLLPTYEESRVERSKKIRLITGELPRTFLLSHNAYELETLRFLAMWKLDDSDILKFLRCTEERLVHSCFDSFCVDGECVGLSLVLLRFWNTYKPQDIETINSMLMKLIDHTLNNTSKIPSFYLWLTLSELADKSELANEIILKFSQDLYKLFQKGWIVNPNNADRYNPIRKYIIKNALSKLPKFNYLKDAEVIISNDGRCYGRFNT
ncbi:hypothetical protein EJP82_06685 [Paenibacillus anaericanus]|uniref:Uncharacterized protein n=1 Tax=Paenibacillus anaericanus TaxID=170367 RepID=A0A3S1BTW6_9BACL|nr:hypothetical protein [Paenibacillus anaericanus]RUT47391.1 hypothetical protein EJP82_06685 [Paenibacillus anaericanus]